MNTLKTGLVLVVLSCLSACGRQVVQFDRDAGPDGRKDGAAGTAAGGGGSGGSGIAGGGGGAGTGGGAPGPDGAVDGPKDVAGIDLGLDGVLDALKDGIVADGGADGGKDAVTDVVPVVAPVVTSTLPANGAKGVAHNATVSATFSKAMDATTLLGTTTFTVKQGATTVAGVVTYDVASKTATFTPALPLGAGLVYTVTITTAAKDAGGTALAANRVWTFTAAADALPPTVTATTPVDLAPNVSINARPTATFSRAMDPATLNGQTFTVKQGLTVVSGVVTLDGATNTATFTPDAPLALGLVYTVTITTGAKDLGGVALAAAHTWSFTTAACSQEPVNLRSASGFAVLAGSTITSTGPTIVTGDLGVSPGTAITGFPPGTMVGALHAGDPTSAQAIADLTTAYNDAKGRTLCPVSVAGDLSGQTLVPGLYKSTSSLEISTGNLVLDGKGDVDAVFIFQMASTLTTTDGRQVMLINGADAANVYWQVGTSATIGTTSAFEGTIMADQAITLKTGATLNGRALARIAAVTLDSNVVTKP